MYECLARNTNPVKKPGNKCFLYNTVRGKVLTWASLVMVKNLKSLNCSQFNIRRLLIKIDCFNY